MKIALYAPAWPPGHAANGIVTYTSLLVSALRRLGHDVFVLSFGPADADPFAVDLNGFLPRRNLLTRAMSKFAPSTTFFNQASSAIARGIRFLVDEHQIDLFEMEESFGWSYEISRLNIIPVIVRLHGPWFLMGKFDHENRKKAQWRVDLEGRGIRQAHYVTANCGDTLNAVKDKYGLTLVNSRVLPNPVDTVSESEAWRLDTCEPNSLLFVGRFDKVKGGDLVLHAFGQLARTYPKLKLTFVGPDRGIRTNDGAICNFHQFVQQNFPEDVRSRIDFRGQQSHAEVMSLRNQHFITIIAAQYDTMGYMMLEAMSRGCPIVSTAVGGIPEYIRDRRNGILVPSQDADAMAAACKTLLDNKDLAAQFGRQNWLDCRELYSSEGVARQMLSAYQAAIDGFRFHQGSKAA